MNSIGWEYNASAMALLSLAWLPRVNSRRCRRAFVACLATLGVSAALLGTVAIVRWRAEHAVRGDTRVVLNQAAQQLLRAFQSRAGTLTLLRDTVDRSLQLALAERKALAQSAVAHTRHLLGIGFVRAGEGLAWWTSLFSTTAPERSLLSRAITGRTRLRTVWRFPSTFTVYVQEDRPLLIMLEPLRAEANRTSAIVGVFDLTPLLADFFELTLQQPYPVQLLDGDRVLYRSSRWSSTTATRTSRPTLARPIMLETTEWTLQMQPGTTQAVQALSWVNVLLIAFSVLVGLSMIGVVWLLAMRTWILQHAVRRRTAALRRTTKRLRQLALTDELTGLYNRRFFLERWQWERDRAKRYGRPLGCLLIDVNGFKRVNDLLGHQMGDLVLKHVAQELKTQLRQSDVLARFGGDEFIIALPETTPAQAASVAEKLRKITLSGPWASDRHVGPVRLSVGLSHMTGEESAQQLIQDADANLYASRRAARGPHASPVLERDVPSVALDPASLESTTPG